MEDRHDLVFRTARELVGLMVGRQVSAREVLDAHLEQIERVDPEVNAVVTLVPERAGAMARQADESIARGRALGRLHGLPALHKDLADTAGVRTTYGSPITARHVPRSNTSVVQRMIDAGVVTMGKTNVPEYGTGSQTYNAVFGATGNAYDPGLTCGGSSGGAAVALACGMAPVCDGSDMAGSLRNPAAWNNVVGLRPTPGRVPEWPNPQPVFTLALYGPMARTVGDVALQMQVIGRPDGRALLNWPEADFSAPLDRDFTGTRIAWSDTLDALPIDERITAAMAPARVLLTDVLDASVEEAEPDMTGVDEAFGIMRAAYYWQMHADDYRARPGMLGENVRWEIEHGRELTVEDLGRAERLRAGVHDRMHAFMADHEFLIAPVVQLPPFPVDQHWPREVAGVPQSYYREWIRVCSRISLTGNPAASVPFSFTSEGLPVGLQIIGRYGDDFGVLQLAHAVETVTGTWKQRPVIAF
ncbi:amidase family protein [Streptomyces sp. NPDC006367]|uniref:amidase n=1 Tax=unclassified Streptomyces TaxID=2593676 RepID=UPI0033BAD02E